jgi:hypothetical protein
MVPEGRDESQLGARAPSSLAFLPWPRTAGGNLQVSDNSHRLAQPREKNQRVSLLTVGDSSTRTGGGGGMSGDDDLIALIDFIYAAVLDGDLWPTVLTKLADTTGTMQAIEIESNLFVRRSMVANDCRVGRQL